MPDNRRYDEKGDVVDGYLTPDEAREQGLEWHARPNEPAPYLTPDESRGLGVPYRSADAFGQYNYDNQYAASARQAPRSRGNNPLEQLMGTIRQMNQTPGGWQSENFRMTPEAKQRTFPGMPSYWQDKPDYSNIPGMQFDPFASSRIPTSRKQPLPGFPQNMPPRVPTGGGPLPLPDPQDNELFPGANQQYQEALRKGPPYPGAVLQYSPWSRSYVWVPPGTRF